MSKPTTEQIIDEVVNAATRFGEKYLIALAGVPGTGKSHVALRAAQRISGHPLFLKQIQFHQAFTYEDFVEGLAPNSSGGYEPRQGVLVQWNDAALRDPENLYVLLIEELTRTNVSAVLGELLTYIEHRTRTFQTPLTRRRLSIASNLVIIATYNPVDRSAVELDDALLRRMQIINCPPSSSQLREMLGWRFNAANGNQEVVDKLAALFDEIETRYPETFGELMPFGHGVFSSITEESDLHTLWEHQLRHILRRPRAPAHVLAAEIEDLYPWRDKQYGAKD